MYNISVNNLSEVERQALEEQAILLTNEIFSLLDQYTHDSNVSKFFLTDEIAFSCFALAGSFVAPCFDPPLSPSLVKKSALLSFYYSLMTYGFNLYLKERSLTTNEPPYMFMSQKKQIKKIRNDLLERMLRGDIISTPLADEVIAMLLKSSQKNLVFSEFSIPDYKLSKSKFYDYARLSLYWGYNFARFVLIEKQRVYK
jgi:hypothetical protein